VPSYHSFPILILINQTLTLTLPPPISKQESESAKAQLDEIAELTSQCDALRRNEADLKLREKSLQTDMKKKGDLARQMLAEKDVIIQQLVASSSSTSGNGSGASTGSAIGSSSSGSINGFVESGPNLIGSSADRSERRQHGIDPRLSPSKDGAPQRSDSKSFQVLLDGIHCTTCD
jgi:hypothetical protein